jgi:two-component sensor histidine kinase
VRLKAGILRGKQVQTIRFRLALALAIALLPVLALSALQSIATFHRETEHQRQDLIDGAERSAAIVRARLASAAVVLRTVRPETAGFDCAPRLRELAGELGGYDRLIRFTASGRVACASGPTPVGAAAGARWFDLLRDGQTTVVARAPSGLERERAPSLLTAVRADRDGNFDGALTAILPLAGLRPSANDPALPKGAEVAVTDRNGQLLTSTFADAFPSSDAGWIHKAGKDGSVVFYGRDAKGARRVFAGAPLQGQDVYVLLSAPAEGLFSFARLNPVVTFVLPLLAWGIAMMAVLVVTERVVIRWLGYLERIASIYAKGRFSVRPVQARNAPLEIRNLAMTLDQMADAIDGRDASLRESLAHKDALMREIHHRVKNNLQVISSLLNMQQRSLQDPAARAAMSDTRQRITALSLIYRALYQSPDLKRVDVRQFLEELIAQLVAGDSARAPLVRTELEADPLVIDPDKLAPLALWAVEAITNAQKHAFEGRGGFLRVRFKVGGEESVLEVEDDGPGADEAAASQGVGRTLMTAFARQLRGRTEILKAEAGGVLARLAFPTPEAGETEPSQPASRPSPPARGGNQAAA